MMAARIIGGGVLVIAVYFAIALEAVFGGRTLLPHGPTVMLVLVAWAVPATPAIFVAAAIGLACDAIGQGAFGPGLIAAVVAVVAGSHLKVRWELETPLAAMLFGVAVGTVLIAGPALMRQVLAGDGVSAGLLQLHVARALSSAMAAVAIILIARGLASMRTLANALVTR